MNPDPSMPPIFDWLPSWVMVASASVGVVLAGLGALFWVLNSMRGGRLGPFFLTAYVLGIILTVLGTLYLGNWWTVAGAVAFLPLWYITLRLVGAAQSHRNGE